MKIKFAPFIFSLAFGFCLISCSTQATQAQSTTDESEERQGPPPNDQQGPPPGAEQGERPNGRQGGPPNFAKILKDLDKDEDGKISETEAAGPLKKDFAKIDTDEDGFINEAEFKAGAPKPPRRN
ncbi:MAG: hypothetical protein AAFN10_01450 [Bacteroidota bacterium]